MPTRSCARWLRTCDPAGNLRRMNLVDRVTARFTEVVGATTTGVWSAPGRITIIGDHTDYNAGIIVNDRSQPQRGHCGSDFGMTVGCDRFPVGDTTTVELTTVCARFREWLGGFSAWSCCGHWAVRAGASGLDIVIDSDIQRARISALHRQPRMPSLLRRMTCGKLNLGRMDLVHACQRAEHDMVGTPTTIVDTATAMFENRTERCSSIANQPKRQRFHFPFPMPDSRYLPSFSDGTSFARRGSQSGINRIVSRAAESLAARTLTPSWQSMTWHACGETQDEEPLGGSVAWSPRTLE